MRGRTIMGIGVLVFSIALFLGNTFVGEHIVINILSGVGIGLELVGFIKQCKDDKKKG
jgi:hypothetical protein